MSEAENARGHLPVRPIAVRARPDARLIRQYQRAAPDGDWLVTPTNASLGFLDPARISRLDPQGRLIAGDAPTKEIPLHAALYETRSSAQAIVHLHSTHSVAVSMLPEIDPARRAAADDRLLPDAGRADRAGAVLSAGRSGRRRRHPRPRRAAIPRCCSPITGRWWRATSLEAAVFATEELEETAKLYLLLRGLNPRYLSPQQVSDLAKR